MKVFYSSNKYSVTSYPNKLFIDSIFDPHLKLKRNVFNNCILDFSEHTDFHRLKFHKNLNKITDYTKWEVWIIIQVLLTFIPKFNNSDIENPLIDQAYSIYYSNDDDHVYQICQIDDYKFSYVTLEFIENDLCKIIDNITLSSNIIFIPYNNSKQASLVKYRYMGLKWGGLEYFTFLTKCLSLKEL